MLNSCSFEILLIVKQHINKLDINFRLGSGIKGKGGRRWGINSVVDEGLSKV